MLKRLIVSTSSPKIIVEQYVNFHYKLFFHILPVASATIAIAPCLGRLVLDQLHPPPLSKLISVLTKIGQKRMARTKQTARQSSGGSAPKRSLPLADAVDGTSNKRPRRQAATTKQNKPQPNEQGTVGEKIVSSDVQFGILLCKFEVVCGMQ